MLAAVVLPSSGAAPLRTGAVGQIAFSDRRYVWAGKQVDNWKILTVAATGGRVRNLTRTPRYDDHSPAWSPDGKWVAFVRSGAGVYLASRDGSQTRIAPAVDADGVSWSPDGSTLAFVAGGWVRTLRVSTREERRIARSNGFSTDWSPDGRSIVFNRTGRGGGIWRVGVGGRGPTRLTLNTQDWDPAWSPDGTQIAFVRNVRPAPGICVMRSDGSGERPLLRQSGLDGPDWSPDGRRLAFGSSSPQGAPGYDGGVWIVDAAGRNARKADGGQIAGLSWGP